MQYCMKLIVALFVACFGFVKADSTHEYSWAFGKETKLLAKVQVAAPVSIADTAPADMADADSVVEDVEEVIEDDSSDSASVATKPAAEPVYVNETIIVDQDAVEKEKIDFKMTRWQQQQNAAQKAAQARQAAANSGR